MQRNSSRRPVSLLLFLVVASLVITPLAPLVTATPPLQSHIQPALLAYAAEYPAKTVRVIIQTQSDAAVDSLVADLGGEIVADLHIIDALAAELPAATVKTLAASDGVRWVSLDAPVERSGKPPKDDPQPAGDPQNYYIDTLNVRPVWDMGLRGDGIGVAVIDSGISNDQDFQQNRLVTQLTFNPNSSSANDAYGHGTHVAGIIGGNGTSSGGSYVGVAPGVNLISLKISDDTGMAYESDTVAAIQWVLNNKDTYNIRVVNLSVNATTQMSYHESALDAAAEILWFNGIVVVASAGNKDADTGYDPLLAAPANDPFLITVGATDEQGDASPRNDMIASFSSYGETLDYFDKPEIHAPGVNIVSILAQNSKWSSEHPDRIVGDGNYFRLSGTSMSAPMVSGAAALLLQDEPNLTPDQVKYRLLNTAGRIGKSNYLDVYAAITGTSSESANTGIEASQLLWTGSDPIIWNSVNWNSVNWNSVNWNSVNWNSVYWGE